jgi:hypothetical protein
LVPAAKVADGWTAAAILEIGIMAANRFGCSMMVSVRAIPSHTPGTLYSIGAGLGHRLPDQSGSVGGARSARM